VQAGSDESRNSAAEQTGLTSASRSGFVINPLRTARRDTQLVVSAAQFTADHDPAKLPQVVL
jgi:hypothetical protein